MKKGILFINLGTPSDLTPVAIKTFLSQFLNDKYVIQIPALFRKILVDGIIVPFRYKNTLEAYSQVWTEKGSPLMHLSINFKNKLQETLGNDYQVALGMRYGEPSIHHALDQLAMQCDEILAIPLYPQFADSSTTTALVEIDKWQSNNNKNIKIKKVRDFFTYPELINTYTKALSTQYTTQLNSGTPEHILFSYHSLPISHLQKYCNTPCKHEGACPKLNSTNADCYRAQCYETSRRIAKQMNLKPEQYSTCFQSRVGKNKWIGPQTDLYLESLRSKGIEHIGVACPGFTVDCLETLEEIAIRLKENWLNLGGQKCTYLSCINEQTQWAEHLAQFVTQI